MNLKQWCDIDEMICIAESDERYKQYAGFDYSEKIIKQLAEMKRLNSIAFLDSFSEPTILFLAALENLSDSMTKNLELKLYAARNRKIISSKQMFNGRPVNWSTWRQYNSAQEDPAKRKQLFDEFIQKTEFISPIIMERFNRIKEVYSRYGGGHVMETGTKAHMNEDKDNVKGRPGTNLRGQIKSVRSSLPVIINPLDGYLAEENISYSRLVSFVRSIGERAKKPFKDALQEMSKKILGRPVQYYDDFYFFRNRVYAGIEAPFAAVRPIEEVEKTLKKMQFDMSRITIDTENRKNKYPSPICFFVQVPNDIRVLYKNESPYFDLQGCFHEVGHAIHASSIKESLPYWDRYRFPMGVAEIFSIFLERLTKKKAYLKGMGITDEKILRELKARNSFMELFFVTFYTANSLMKAEFWRKNLTAEQAGDLYSKLIKEYTGIEDMPGSYWMLHHILPDAIMYVPSYLLAAVRAAELDSHLKDRFGETWWTEPNTGRYIREIMEPGAGIDLSRFSSLDTGIFLREITE